MAAIPFVCPRGKKGEWMCVQFPFRVICTHSDLLTAFHWIVFIISLFGGDSLVICRCLFTPTPYATSGCNTRIHARLICLVEQLFKNRHFHSFFFPGLVAELSPVQVLGLIIACGSGTQLVGPGLGGWTYGLAACQRLGIPRGYPSGKLT